MKARLQPVSLIVLCLCLIQCAGIQKYGELLPEAAPASHGSSEVKLSYLGCSGYLLEAPGTVILIDPYFSRHSILAAALNTKIPAKEKRIEEGLALAGVPNHVDAILVTHGHFDHLLDVPYVQNKLGGKVVGSETSCYLAEAVGTPREVLVEAHPGSVIRAGQARIHILKAAHDRLFGKLPIPGQLNELPDTKPKRPGDWVCGCPLAFLIEIGGRRIYMDSGGMPGHLPPSKAVGVDVAILGVALPDSRGRYSQTVKFLRPKYVLPNHQDNCFAPISRGFRFGPLTDFPEVLSAHHEEGLEADSELILLDYFTPWTLP